MSGSFRWVWSIAAVFLCVELVLWLVARQLGVVEPAVADPADAFTEPRASVCLNGEWRIQAAPDDSAPGQAWTSIRIPESFAPDVVARGAAWVETDVYVPAAWKGRGRVLLRFDKAQHYARVEWNARVAGEHYGPRVGFDVDATEGTRYGATNRLRVYVAAISKGRAWAGVSTKDLFALQFYTTDSRRLDDAFIGGDVFLDLRPTRRLAAPAVATSVRDHTLTATVRVENGDPKPLRGRIRWRVRERGRTVLELPEQSIEVPSGEAKDATATVAWKNPKLWGPPGYGEPVLYTLVAELDEDGALRDRARVPFGFRELSVDDGGRWLLNGKPIFLTGVRAPENLVDRHKLAVFLHEQQSAGVNTVESHKESRPAGFYDVADHMGALVISGNFCSGAINPDERNASPDSAALAALGQVFSTWGTEERNHPSIVMWGPCAINPFVREAIYRPLRQVDATRPMPFDTFLPFGVDPTRLDPWPPQGGRPSFVFETIVPRDNVVQDAASLRQYVDRVRKEGAFGLILPQLPQPTDAREHAVHWPSSSGLDPRPATLILPARFPDESAWRDILARPGDSPESPTAPDKRPFPPELMVTVTGVARPLVVLVPLEGQEMEPTGVVGDAQGRAWFMVREPGRYRAFLLGGRPARADVEVKAATLSEVLTMQTATELRMEAK